MTTAPTFRIESDPKETSRTAADGEHRSISDMVEVMTWDYYDRNNIAIPQPPALFPEKNRKPQPPER